MGNKESAPQPELPSAKPPRKCWLELLPLKLRIAILYACPDIVTIKGLVHASPIYYAVYKSIRHELLLNILHGEYEGAVNIVDAIVALRSRGLYADNPANKEKIYSLLDQLRRHEEIRRLGLPSAIDLPDKPAGPNETYQLIRLHEAMKFCLNNFCNTVKCPEWATPKRWRAHVTQAGLSCTEKTRIFRALYRLQIYANIFADKEVRPNEKESRAVYNIWRYKTFFQGEAIYALFGPMTPWEFQEIGCVWQSIYERYTDPYREVAKYLLDTTEKHWKIGMPTGFVDNEKLERPIPENYSVLDTDELWSQQHARQTALATMGPAFFYKFICKGDFLDRRDLILVNSPWSDVGFPHWDGAALMMGEYFELLHPADSFNPREDWYQIKMLWTTLEPTQRPNIAWNRIWFSNHKKDKWVLDTLYGGDNNMPCWKWGYAIWDDERLIKLGAPLDRLEWTWGYQD